MKKRLNWKVWVLVVCTIAMLLPQMACNRNKDVKIGVSLGIGPSKRWEMDKAYMEERAVELKIPIEVLLNRADSEKTQVEECRQLIDGGISTLVLMLRNPEDGKEILTYAQEKGVKVLSYARMLQGHPVDLFVGYDSYNIGRQVGQSLVERVYEGDYLLLKGDPDDFNTPLLFDGAMSEIKPLVGAGINIIGEEFVKGWSAEEAVKLVKEAVAANGNKVDAILAPNDTLAAACVQALEELGVTEPVIISGMDADLAAVQRIVAQKQECTVYMDLKTLAYTAVDHAKTLGEGKTVKGNAAMENGSGSPVSADLITGKLITNENVDEILVKSGYYTKEQVYGAK